MKIGIITFHWGANHGAILQCYALCSFLKEAFNAEVEVIHYLPCNLEITTINALKHIRGRALFQKLKEVKKDKMLRSFRQRLPLSQRFYTNQELTEKALDYDVLITGSDQIWNPFFLMNGENKVTPVYYLNFGSEHTRRISVSASFGCKELPEECKRIAKSLLKRFDAISVRENTGLDILMSMDITDAQVTADPTALIAREDMLKLCGENAVIEPQSVSKFILRKQNRQTNTLINAICSKYSCSKANDIEMLSIPEWLAAIRDSKVVVTNSFHCVMMCLKLHTPFAVVLENGVGAGMNDRFITLLGSFGLQDRIITKVEEIGKLSSEIDFSAVDSNMEKYSESLKRFLKGNINNEQIQ